MSIGSLSEVARAGVVVVDTDLRVLAWHAAAVELWGVREGEVRGHSLMELDIGLPVSELHGTLRRRFTKHNATYRQSRRHMSM